MQSYRQRRSGKEEKKPIPRVGKGIDAVLLMNANLNIRKQGKIMQRHLHHPSPSRSVVSGMESAQTSKTGIPNPLAMHSSKMSWLFSLMLIFIVGMALSSVASGQMTMDVDHEMDVARASQGSNAPAYTIISCGKSGQQPLPVGDYNSDLHVVGPCVADGTLGIGIYKYHWVFIHNGGTLTFDDAKLDLYASSILVLYGGTLKAGGPSETTPSELTAA